MSFRVLFIIVSLLLVSNSYSQEKKVYITGMIVLDNQSDYSGVNILFQRTVPSKKEYTLISDSSGKFGLELDEGIYNISLTKKYYDSVSIKDVSLFTDKDIEQIDMHYLGEFLSGAIKGVLKSGVYEVRYSLKVIDGDTLTIEPGTIMKFYGNVVFTIQGCLYALGTEKQPIKLISIDENTYWSGIEFEGDGTYRFSAILDYMIIEKTNGVGLDTYNYRSFDFNHILFNNNLANVQFSVAYPPSILRNSVISNNKSQYVGGIYMNATEMDIENCIIAFNENAYKEDIFARHGDYAGGIGIGTANWERSKFKNCLIYGNKANFGAGINTSFETKFINCVIANNIAYHKGGGVHYYKAGSSELINCIVTNNKTILKDGTEIDDYQITGADNEPAGNLIVRNSVIYDKKGLVWDNPGNYFGKFVRTNFNVDSTDAYGNIFLDPLLADVDNNDFKLLPGSHAIDAGINIDLLPVTDFLNNIRLWDGNNDNFAIVDMGAYEYLAPIKQLMQTVFSDDLEGDYTKLEVIDKNEDDNFFVQTEEESHTGKTSLFIQNSNSSCDDWIVSDNLTTQNGQKYFLSFWVKFSGEPFVPENDKITVNYSPNGENILSGNYTIIEINKIEREWQKVQIELNTVGSTHAKFAISANLNSNLKLFFDDIQMETEFVLSVDNRVISNNDNVNVYPIPADNELTINIKSEESGLHIVTIYNTQGFVQQELSQQDDLSNRDISIDVSNYPTGLYFIKVQSPFYSELRKFIIIH